MITYICCCRQATNGDIIADINCKLVFPTKFALQPLDRVQLRDDESSVVYRVASIVKRGSRFVVMLMNEKNEISSHAPAKIGALVGSASAMNSDQRDRIANEVAGVLRGHYAARHQGAKLDDHQVGGGADGAVRKSNRARKPPVLFEPDGPLNPDEDGDWLDDGDDDDQRKATKPRRRTRGRPKPDYTKREKKSRRDGAAGGMGRAASDDGDRIDNDDGAGRTVHMQHDTCTSSSSTCGASELFHDALIAQMQRDALHAAFHASVVQHQHISPSTSSCSNSPKLRR